MRKELLMKNDQYKIGVFAHQRDAPLLTYIRVFPSAAQLFIPCHLQKGLTLGIIVTAGFIKFAVPI